MEHVVSGVRGTSAENRCDMSQQIRGFDVTSTKVTCGARATKVQRPIRLFCCLSLSGHLAVTLGPTLDGARGDDPSTTGGKHIMSRDANDTTVPHPSLAKAANAAAATAAAAAAAAVAARRVSGVVGATPSSSANVKSVSHYNPIFNDPVVVPAVSPTNLYDERGGLDEKGECVTPLMTQVELNEAHAKAMQAVDMFHPDKQTYGVKVHLNTFSPNPQVGYRTAINGDVDYTFPACLPLIVFLHWLFSDSACCTKRGMVSVWPLTVIYDKGKRFMPCVAVHVGHTRFMLQHQYSGMTAICTEGKKDHANKSKRCGFSTIMRRMFMPVNPNESHKIDSIAGTEPIADRVTRQKNGWVLIPAAWLHVISNIFVRYSADTDCAELREIMSVLRMVYRGRHDLCDVTNEFSRVCNRFHDDFRCIIMGSVRTPSVQVIRGEDSVTKTSSWTRTRAYATFDGDTDSQRDIAHVAGSQSGYIRLQPMKLRKEDDSRKLVPTYTENTFGYGIECHREQLRFMSSMLIFFRHGVLNTRLPGLIHLTGIMTPGSGGPDKVVLNRRETCVIGLYQSSDTSQKAMTDAVRNHRNMLVREYGRDFTRTFWGVRGGECIEIRHAEDTGPVRVGKRIGRRAARDDETFHDSTGRPVSNPDELCAPETNFDTCPAAGFSGRELDNLADRKHYLLHAGAHGEVSPPEEAGDNEGLDDVPDEACDESDGQEDDDEEYDEDDEEENGQRSKRARTALRQNTDPYFSIESEKVPFHLQVASSSSVTLPCPHRSLQVCAPQVQVTPNSGITTPTAATAGRATNVMNIDNGGAYLSAGSFDEAYHMMTGGVYLTPNHVEGECAMGKIGFMPPTTGEHLETNSLG